MKDLTMKNFKKLPESVKKDEEEKKQK